MRCRLRDTDSGGYGNIPGRIAVIPDPKAFFRRRQVAAIIARPGDAECFGQPPRPARQLDEIFLTGDCGPTGLGHFFNTRQRLQRPEKHTSRATLGLARDIQTVVIAVDEIDVRVSWRTEKHFISRRLPRSRVCRWIIFPKIGFDLYDPPCQKVLACVTNQDFSKEVSRDALGIARVECAIKRTNLGRRRKVPPDRHAAESYMLRSEAASKAS